MTWHHAELPGKQLVTRRIQQRLKQVNENIQPNQESVYVRRAVSWLVVSDREHRRFGKLVLQSTTGRVISIRNPAAQRRHGKARHGSAGWKWENSTSPGGTARIPPSANDPGLVEF